MLITVESEVFLSPARVLVNPVNTAGVMSSGISAEFKRFFPGAFSHYRSLCEAGQFEPGRLFLYRADFRTIVHLPVKKHWRTATTAQIIEAGLQKLAANWAEQGIQTLAIPRFGDGELDWDSVIRPLLETYLGSLPIPVYVHYQPVPDPRRSIKLIDQMLNKPSQSVPFSRLWKDIGRIVRRAESHFSTENRTEYTIAYQDGTRYNRLVVTPSGNASINITGSALAELWAMLNSARLLLPSQFPSGLEQVAPYLLPLLGRTDYVRLVRAAMGDATPLHAILLIPPADNEPRKLTFLPGASV